MKTQKKSIFTALKSPSADLWLFAIMLVLLNLVSLRAFARFDITGPRSYSLAKASKETVRTVQEPLAIKVFFTKNLPAPYNSVYQYVQDILSEYKTAAKKNFSYELFDMSKPENENQAFDYGLSQIQIRELKNNEVGFKNVFMGMVITYADQIEVLDRITSTDGLEYEITQKIAKVVAAANEFSSLTGLIHATLYKSDNLAPLDIQGFDELERTLSGAVAKLNEKYANRLDFVSVNPPSGDIAMLHERFGLPSVPFQTAGGTYEYGTIALVLQNGDNYRTIPFGIGQSLDLARGRIFYTLQGLDTVEEDIDASLRALASQSTTVAYITGHGERSLSDSEEGSAYFASQLQERYVLKQVNLLEEDIPLGVQTVMINGPQEAFTHSELYKLDQFLLKGGALLLFLDPFRMRQSAYGTEYVPLDTGLEILLKKYGISLPSEYVMDTECAISSDGRQQQRAYYIPVVQQNTLNQKHPVTKNLGMVGMVIPGSIDVEEAKEKPQEKVTILATSSARSWAVSEHIQLDPTSIRVPEKSAFQPHNLAVLVEGTFESAYEAPPKDSSQQEEDVQEAAAEQGNLGDSHLQKSVQNGKVLVFSTSYITGPDLSMQFFGQTVMLLQNALDYLNGSEDLCTMRTKGLSVNTLTATGGSFVNVCKYFNEVGLSVLVAILGLLAFAARRKHRKEVRLVYDPDDSRELLGQSAAHSKKGGNHE